jgi:hypothetical protein
MKSSKSRIGSIRSIRSKSRRAENKGSILHISIERSISFIRSIAVFLCVSIEAYAANAANEVNGCK